jgi:hypothetical protein
MVARCAKLTPNDPASTPRITTPKQNGGCCTEDVKFDECCARDIVDLSGSVRTQLYKLVLLKETCYRNANSAETEIHRITGVGSTTTPSENTRKPHKWRQSDRNSINAARPRSVLSQKRYNVV